MGSLTPADTRQRELPPRLRRATRRSPFAELRASGIHLPAVVVSELQVGGYAFEHVREQGRMVGVRRVESDPTFTPAVLPARLTSRAHRIRRHRLTKRRTVAHMYTPTPPDVGRASNRRLSRFRRRLVGVS
jgi:hypothetical protein